MGKRYCDSPFDSRIFLPNTAARAIRVLRFLFWRADISGRDRSRECQARIAETARAGRVLPQGICIPLSGSQPEERERIRSELRPAGWPADTVVILGAGAVDIQKRSGSCSSLVPSGSRRWRQSEDFALSGSEREWTASRNEIPSLSRRSDSALRTERGGRHPKGGFRYGDGLP